MKYLHVIAFFGFAVTLFANPQNHAVLHGQAEVSGSGALMEVNTGDRAVVSWESFSIAAGETVRFNQPTEHSAILNRVTGPLSSEIMGMLEANGNVYLVNPNGILIGPEGQINTAGFFASVYEVSDTEFMDAESMRISGSELGEIVNLGTIKTANGPVTLIAHRIENLGNIEAPGGVVSCFSGHDLLFDPTGDNILYICPDIKGDGVDQNGRIQALKTVLEADTAPTTLAIGLGGIITATCIEEVGGEIYLTAREGDIEIVSGGQLFANEEGKVRIQAEKGCVDFRGEIKTHSGEVHLLGENVYLLDNALIDVSAENQGGTILIGGDYQGKNPDIQNAKYVYTGPDVTIDLDAKHCGDGGRAIFWGDKGNAYFAHISANGGKEGGDGGFVEVSSPQELIFKGSASRLAPKGKAGKLFLDPSDIVISAAATSGGSFSGGPSNVFSGTVASVTLNVGDLETNLGLGDVDIETAGGGGGGSGSLTFSAPVSWSANTLTLNISGATRQPITIDADLNISGSGSFLVIPAGFTPGSLTILNSGRTINHTSSAPTLSLISRGVQIEGNIICTQSTDIILGSTSGASTFDNTNAVVTTAGTGNITLLSSTASGFTDTSGTYTVENGTITFGGRGACTCNSTTLRATGSGDINFSTGNAGIMAFTGCSLITAGSGDITMGTLAAGSTFTNCNFTNNGTGTATFVTSPDPLIDGCTFATSSPLTLDPPILYLNGSTNFTTTDTVTISSAATQIVGNTTITTQSSTLSFPVGVNSISDGDDLTINSTGSLSFGGTSSLTVLTASVDGTIDFGSSTVTTTTGGLSCTAGTKILLGDSFTITSETEGALVAGTNITMSGTTGTIQTATASDFNLVVDNLNPNPPNFGTGMFTLPGGLTLQTNSGAGDAGKILLFASSPYLANSLPSVINTESYTPGTLVNGVYITGTNEFQGFWYITQPPPDPPLFQVMYKQTSTLSGGALQAVEIAIVEPVTNPDQIAQVVDGNLTLPSTPDPKTACRTPPVAVQSS